MNINTENAGSYYIAKVLAGRYQAPRRSPLVYLLVTLACLAMLWPTVAKGESSDKTLHFAVSYGLTTGIYGVLKQMHNSPCRFNRAEAGYGCQLGASERFNVSLFAAALTTVVGVTKEMLDDVGDSGDVLANGLGSGAAMLSIFAFEF